ncbi:MAG TPA: outer membrane protein assembly factor BamD [Rhodocyclaceae bacterium]|nr:outer membrane protein assembly factor BamD [Rhodocyclaceae bacterium]
MRSLAAFAPIFRLLTALALAAALAGCGLLPEVKDETAGWSASKLYAEAKDAQVDGAWDKASKLLEKLEARFPYGRYSQQAQLELGYVYWKANEPASALAACDRFIKLHPNHPGVDYVYYLKGLIGFNEDLGLLGHLSQQDMSERDPKSAKESFEAFRELVTRFPKSKYTPDAIERMNYLVNALAMQEVHVARYYIKRGAYIAAANRAQFAVKTYPNAPANEEALFIMVSAYDKLGMNELRDDAERILRKNFPKSRFLTGDVAKKEPWWKLW